MPVKIWIKVCFVEQELQRLLAGFQQEALIRHTIAEKHYLYVNKMTNINVIYNVSLYCESCEELLIVGEKKNSFMEGSEIFEPSFQNEKESYQMKFLDCLKPKFLACPNISRETSSFFAHFYLKNNSYSTPKNATWTALDQ